MRPRTQAWLDAAASCGLEVMEVSDRSGVQAWTDRLEVRIEPCEDKRRTRVVVVIPGPLDFIVVRIRTETDPSPREQDIQCGDPSFDNRFLIKGPIWPVLALLDAETRGLLVHMSTECDLAIYNGSLRAEMPDGDVARLLPRLLDLGRRFDQVMKMDVSRRLAENVARDPEAGVRLQNLLVLIREHPGEPATVEALRTACSDSSPKVRLRAAMELNPKLRELASGQLSLAEAEVGQLSLAQAEAGQLSLAKDPAGQLSLSDEEED